MLKSYVGKVLVSFISAFFQASLVRFFGFSVGNTGGDGGTCDSVSCVVDQTRF